jgi:hypothetical protein
MNHSRDAIASQVEALNTRIKQLQLQSQRDRQVLLLDQHHAIQQADSRAHQRSQLEQAEMIRLQQAQSSELAQLRRDKHVLQAKLSSMNQALTQCEVRPAAARFHRTRIWETFLESRPVTVSVMCRLRWNPRTPLPVTCPSYSRASYEPAKRNRITCCRRCHWMREAWGSRLLVICCFRFEILGCNASDPPCGPPQEGVAS